MWIPARRRHRGPAIHSTEARQDKREQSHQIWFLLLGRLFQREGLGLPCSCHFSCFRTSVKRQRRCPCAGRAWFTNISGEYNYIAPLAGRAAAVCGLRKEQRRGGRGHWMGAAFSFYCNICFQPGIQAYSYLSALWFIKPTFSPAVGKLTWHLRLICYMVRAAIQTNSSPAVASTFSLTLCANDNSPSLRCYITRSKLCVTALVVHTLLRT